MLDYTFYCNNWKKILSAYLNTYFEDLAHKKVKNVKLKLGQVTWLSLIFGKVFFYNLYSNYNPMSIFFLICLHQNVTQF